MLDPDGLMISDTLSFAASIAPGSTLLLSGPCGLGKLILLDSSEILPYRHLVHRVSRT